MGKNISYLWQPHFKTDVLRPACCDQCGDKYNYIIVCCSPKYNGVYRWEASKKDSFKRWSNGGKSCLLIPIYDCEKLYGLDEIKDERVLNRIEYERNNYKKYCCDNNKSKKTNVTTN